MHAVPAAALALLLVSALLVLAAFAWYSAGWRPFEWRTGSSPYWPAPGAGVAGLRFRRCTFAVERGDGARAAADVTAVLTGMATAYKGAPAGATPPTLTLDRPLNAFSFVIEGFNDRASVPDPTLPAWRAARASLAGETRVV